MDRRGEIKSIARQPQEPDPESPSRRRRIGSLWLRGYCDGESLGGAMATIPRLHVPMLQPADLIPHLGKGKEHWKPGRSAHALATVWHRANGIPANVLEVLRADPALELIDGFFERQVDLGDGRRPSQTDLMAICADQSGLFIIGVEGKVDETFGPRVSDWRDGSPTKEARLKSLCTMLSLDPASVGALRYQLLHRAASVLLEARRYRACRGALLVHSFHAQRAGLEDFIAFSKAIGFADVAVNSMSVPRTFGGTQLAVGWIADTPPSDTTASVDGK